MEAFYIEQQTLIELLQSSGWSVQSDAEDNALYVMEKGEKRFIPFFINRWKMCRE